LFVLAALSVVALAAETGFKKSELIKKIEEEVSKIDFSDIEKEIHADLTKQIKKIDIEKQVEEAVLERIKLSKITDFIDERIGNMSWGAYNP